MNARWLVCAAVSVASASCVPMNQRLPDLERPATIVTIQPDRPWIDTGITVRQGQWLFITASGDVFWEARRVTAGPDGVDGGLGWHIGPGGLVGRVGTTAKPFDIGARTHPFRTKSLRSRYEFAPPPIQMNQSGSLFLGFKQFTAGPNRGSFEITIRPSQ